MNPLVELIEDAISGQVAVGDDGRLRKLKPVERRAIAVAAAAKVVQVNDPELLCQIALRQLLSLASPLEPSDEVQAITTIRNAIESLLRSLPRAYVHVALRELMLKLAASMGEVPYDPLRGHDRARDLATTLESVEKLANYHYLRYLQGHPDSNASSAKVSERILNVIKGYNEEL